MGAEWDGQTPHPHPGLAASGTAGLPGSQFRGAALDGVGSRISQETWDRGWTHVGDLVTSGCSSTCHTDQQGCGDRHGREEAGPTATHVHKGSALPKIQCLR